MKTINTKRWSAKNEAEKKEAKKNFLKIHNLLIVDESGSMGAIYEAALNGMNETLATIQQDAAENPQQPQEVTLITFDTEHYKEIFKNTPVKEVRKLNYEDYRPGGCTPLYDAMGRAITTLEKQVKEGEGVLVTIITDGMENASCEYTVSDIKAMIERLSEKGWLFSYIGANQDAITVAETMSIKASMNFDATPEGTNVMWEKERNARKKYYKKNRELGADFAACDDLTNFF